MATKTIKELADELGISKQRVYRYCIKNHITDAHHDAGVMQLSDAEQTIIKQHFSQIEPHQKPHRDAHHEAHHEAHHDAVSDAVYDALILQLAEKDRQLAEKDDQIRRLQQALDQEQQLHAAEIQKQLQLDPPKKPGLLARLFNH